MIARNLLLFIIVFLFPGCRSQTHTVSPVAAVDLNRFAGRWYEIASATGRFQKGCQCTTAEYTLKTGKDYIEAVNRCFRGGKWTQIRGKAFRRGKSGDGKLKVQFFWPFRADYWIIALAPDYSWAVVSGPSMKYLWILCRKPGIDKEVYDHIIQLIRNTGFDDARLAITRQDC